MKKEYGCDRRKVTGKTLKVEEKKGERHQIPVCSQWNLDEDKHVVQPVSPTHWEVFSYRNFRACLICRTA